MNDTFAALAGQPAAAARLRAAVDAPLPAYLFLGPEGSGKRDAARRFAGEIFARGLADDAADRQRRLATSEQHPDLVIIERKGPTITADQAREVVTGSAMSPTESPVKIMLLVDFHLVGERAAMVLKAIEEPPPTAMFVILANDLPPELVTIASRCVRVDFAPIPETELVARLVADGVDPATAAAAGAGAGGDLGRARLLATDPSVVVRLDAWRDIPMRLDGSGHVVATIIGELLELVEAAAEPLKSRQAGELVELEERVERFGERGSGRKDLVERHKRELRRLRTDELRAGMATLGARYRELLAAGEHVEPDHLTAAGDLLTDAVAALPRNPSERLLLQSVFVQLPVLH